MKDWLKRLDERTNEHRPSALLGVVLLIALAILVLNWLNDGILFSNLFYPARLTVADVRFWSALVSGLVLLMGLPVAFMLWHWRDRNVRDGIEEQRRQVENARKDTNLKEFQEVQLRAAWALDEKLPKEAREQLQIAALHQLRIFLQPDQPESFRRAAFELLLAGHAAAIYRIGVPEVQAQLEGKSRQVVDAAIKALRLKFTPTDHARMSIIRDEFRYIFHRDFPLNGRRFDFLNLSEMHFPDQLNLNSCHFFAAQLWKSSLTGADLYHGNLECAVMWGVNFSNSALARANCSFSELAFANFENAKLAHTNFRDATLSNADFPNAYLASANFQGANFSFGCIEGAEFFHVLIDARTKFYQTRFSSTTFFDPVGTVKHWTSLTEAERDAARAPWIARGMTNVDAPPPEPADG